MPNPNPAFSFRVTATELQDQYPLDFERVFGLVAKDYLRIAFASG